MATDEMDADYEEAECPTCGAIIPLDAAECPECGQIFEEEEELWESEEEELSEEELEDEWEDILEEEPSKGKLYLGIIVLLFGSVGLTFMSWFHNVIGIFHDMGIGGYDGYGPIDQMVGASGAIVSIIGLVLIYLWYKETKEEDIPEEDLMEDEEFFDEEEEWDEEDEGFFDEEEEYPEEVPGMEEESEPVDEEIRQSQQVQ